MSRKNLDHSTAPPATHRTLLTSPHTTNNRYSVTSLTARAGVSPSFTCARRGGALQVLGNNTTVQVIERDGLIAALVSPSVTKEQFMQAYDATLPEHDDGENQPEGESRRRVNALKKALGDLHADGGAFSVVAFDVTCGRVLAARTANAAPLHYGFTQDGSLVACAGFTAKQMFPDAGDAALKLTPLPSGRFIFGHRFVKPIEFTRFWDTALSNRSAAPARGIEDVNDTNDCGAEECQRRRWGKTGSAGDEARRWSIDKSVAVVPLKSAGAGAFVPSAVRKARAAEAAATAKSAEEESTVRPESPRTAARKIEADAQIAKALVAQEIIVSSLGEALVAAVAKAPASIASLKRGSLKSNTFTIGRVPGMGAEVKKTGLSGLSGLSKLRTSSFANSSASKCAESHPGFASFKANFERMSAQMA